MTIDFTQLSTAEKILQLQDLWDGIASDPRHVEVSEDWKQELRRRVSAHLANPNETLSEAEVAERFAKR
ncbi:MAG: putative addiction module component (TIGR02574 family) [Cognaticolwellia sp.]|jgi:putative addiction module component (TIGR02574 family)